MIVYLLTIFEKIFSRFLKILLFVLISLSWQSFLTPSPHPFNSLNTPSMLPVLYPPNKHILSRSFSVLSQGEPHPLGKSERLGTPPHLPLNNIHGCSWALVACAPVLVVPTVLQTKYARHNTCARFCTIFLHCCAQNFIFSVVLIQ